jgi:hypothetical protein
MASPIPPQPQTRVIGSPDRLWFPLRDVLLLAVHAMGTPRRSFRAAQPSDPAPSGPALLWQSGADGDTLASNGRPAWYDRDGHPKVARAHRWHTAAARRLAAADRHGYLPLLAEHDDVRLFSRLFTASRDKHWLSIDVTSPDPVIKEQQITIAEQHGGGYPADVTWTEATVACVPHTGSGIYPALIADGYHNTHHGVPARFDAPTVSRMIVDLSRARRALGFQSGTLAELRWAGDRVEVYEEQLLPGVSRLRRYDVVGPDADGLYPLGAHLWIWLPVDLSR